MRSSVLFVLRRIRPACAPVLCLALASQAVAQSMPPLSPVPSPPAPTPVVEGAPVSVTLSDVVALALRDNRGIRSAYLQRVVQKFDLVVAERQFRPRLIINASAVAARVGGVDSTVYSVTPSVTWALPTGAAINFSWTKRSDRLAGTGSESGTLSANQPLLRGAGLDVNLAPLRIARLQEQINQLGLKSTVSDTVTGVVLQYRALLQAQEQVRLAELALQRTQDLLETNKALIEAGRMAAADIVQTESGVANQQFSLIQARQQLRSTQLSLLQLLALDLRTNIIAGDKITAEHAAIDLNKVIALALDSRMDILSQRKSLEAARQNLIVARNGRLWALDLVGTMDRQHATGPLPGGPDLGTNSSIGLQLSIPFGDDSPKQAELAAVTGVRTGELNLEGLTQSVEAQVRDAVQNVEASWLQLEAARRARTLAAQALEIQREKLKAGRSSNFEVLSFQADLRAADAQELSASISYLNSLTALDQQIGSTLDTWRINLND